MRYNIPSWGWDIFHRKTPPTPWGISSLRDLEPLVDMIMLTLYTGYIKNVPKPNSLLIIAKPESGKTEALKKFIPNKNVAYISDVTAYGIQRDFLPKIETGEVRHIIIPDLIKPLSRKQSTVKTFVTMMNSLIEEGISVVSTYATPLLTYQKPIKCGLITAITSDEFKDHRHRWTSIGFLSRTIPFSYSYSIETVKKVFDYILGLDYLKEQDIELKRIPKQDKKIKLPRKYAQAILPSTATIAEAQKTYGFRLQKQFQALLQASALERGRDAVNSTDLERVLHLMGWVNFDENPIASRRLRK
ncbi:MAG: hypothetical protein ACHQ03_07880 [Candidatus Bathyarchaeia archaeon]